LDTLILNIFHIIFNFIFSISTLFFLNVWKALTCLRITLFFLID